MNNQQYQFLKKCADTNDANAWNYYRESNSGKKVDLRFANLRDLDLRGFDFKNTNFMFSALRDTQMTGCDIENAKLYYANPFIDKIINILAFLLPTFISLLFILWIQRFDGGTLKASLIGFVSINLMLYLVYFNAIENFWEDVFQNYTFLEGLVIIIVIPLVTTIAFPVILFVNLRDFNKRVSEKLKIFSQTLNPHLAIGYVAPKKDKNEIEKAIERLEAETYRITDTTKQAEIKQQIEELKAQINQQEVFKSRVENSFRDLQKPNSYLDRLLWFNWGLLTIFALLFVVVLVAVGFVEYQVYQKYWVNNQELKEIPYLAYSPIVLGVVVFSFSISQFNKRLNEIKSIYDRKRFVGEVESTLRAFGNFYAADTPKIEDYFTQTINKLQDYYFKGQELDKKAEEKEEGGIDLKFLSELVTKLADKK